MSNDNTDTSKDTVTINVPAAACAGLQEFLAKALEKLPPGMEGATAIYQTLDQVLGYLGQSAVDGVDRTITISVRHIGADEVSINVNSALHLPPANAAPGKAH